MHHPQPALPHLPYEIWEQILDLLDTPALLAFQKVCSAWRHTLLSYVMDGRLKSRALVSIVMMPFGKLFSWPFCAIIYGKNNR